MIFRYAGYDHDNAECLPTFYGSFRRINDRGRTQSRVWRLAVSGEIVAVGQSAINARIAEIKNAYALEGGTAVLLKDDGSESEYRLSSSGSISGVRIVDGPNFTMEEGKAHWATGLPFNVTFEAEYFVSDGDPLISYQETITKIGNGGPRVVWVELDNGPPVSQIVSTHTPVIVIQAGQAVGAAAYPYSYVPGYLFPANLDNPDEVNVHEHPRQSGNGHVDWTLSWVYRYTLNANPGNASPQLR
jgi:hypothetical protein